MKRSNRILLIFGVVLAAVSFVVVLAFGSFGQAPSEPDEVSVVVAAQDLALGQEVTSDAVTTITRSAADTEENFQYPEDVIGKIVRRPVRTGQALSVADFRIDGALPEVASALAPGMRAVAVPLSRFDSVGALLQPGDRVDAILALKDLDGLNPVVIANPGGLVPGPEGSSYSPYFLLDDYVNNTSIKVVVQNVQVLAVLSRLSTEEDGNSGSSDEPDVTVVLALTPQQVEVVRFAQMDGNVSLALRAPGDSAAGDVTTSGITLGKLVEEYGVLPPLPVTP